MKQYCRYCSHCNQCEEDMGYCEIKNKVLPHSTITRINNCSNFEFCEIDTLNPSKRYKPKKPKTYEQLTFLKER